MRRSHAASHIRSPKQMSAPPGSKTPPPNVQVLSNEVFISSDLRLELC